MASNKTTAFFQNVLGAFQGGGCCGAAFAGAFESARRHGVQFAEVAGTSAGSIVAAIVGAGADAEQAVELVRTLDFKQLMGPLDAKIGRRRPILRWFVRRFGYESVVDLACHRGLYSPEPIERWVEDALRKILKHSGRAAVTFEQLPIPTSIVATDIRTRRVMVWSPSRTPQESVAHAVSASCAIPLFFQPVAGRYVDGGALSNLPTFVFSNVKTDRPSASRVLAFTLHGEERLAEEPTDTLGYLRDVVSTIVEGSQALQTSMQDGVHTVTIPTGTVKATDFDKMSTDVVTSLIKSGRDATDAFFSEEAVHVSNAAQSGRACLGLEEMYAALTENLDRSMKTVLIVDEQTKWAFDIFPTLLIWRRRGVQLRLILAKAPAHDKQENYRRRLLKSLGADIKELDSVPYRGFIVDSDSPFSATALIRVDSHSPTPSVEAVRYDGALDGTLIRTFREHAELQVTGNWQDATDEVQFAEGNEEALRGFLRKLPQYAQRDVEISIERVPIAKMVPLTEKIKEFKYKQLRHLHEIYSHHKVPLFAVAKLTFGDGKISYVTPPVLEANGSGYIVVEGTARMLYCRNQGIGDVLCVVARNVLSPLPASPKRLDRARMVGRTLRPEERYDNWKHQYLRQIELNVHDPESY